MKKIAEMNAVLGAFHPSMSLVKIEKWYRRRAKAGGKRNQYYLVAGPLVSYMGSDGESNWSRTVQRVRVDFDVSAELTIDMIKAAVASVHGSLEAMAEKARQETEKEEARLVKVRAEIAERDEKIAAERAEAMKAATPETQMKNLAAIVTASAASDSEKLDWFAREIRAVVADRYRQEFLRLVADPAMVAMARDLAKTGNPRWFLEGPESYEFSIRAREEARARGVQAETIGGIPHAMKYLVSKC